MINKPVGFWIIKWKMQRVSVSTVLVQDFETSFTHLNKVSVAIAFFILEMYLGVPFSWLDLESQEVLDRKVDPYDFSYRYIG